MRLNGWRLKHELVAISCSHVASATREGIGITCSTRSLVEMHTVRGDPQDLVPSKMQKSNVCTTKGLCAALVALCAEAKFFRVAEGMVSTHVPIVA